MTIHRSAAVSLVAGCAVVWLLAGVAGAFGWVATARGEDPLAATYAHAEATAELAVSAYLRGDARRLEALSEGSLGDLPDDRYPGHLAVTGLRRSEDALIVEVTAEVLERRAEGYVHAGTSGFHVRLTGDPPRVEALEPERPTPARRR